MKRREFIILLGGAAAWPVVSKAQQAERVRLVGMISILGLDDPEGQARSAVFKQTLQQLGWTVGRDLKIETRQIGPDLDSVRRYAVELVAHAPDVIFSVGSISVASLQQATRTIPIVFTNVPDPVGAGIVQSMAHPGGNITGFSSFEYSMSGKWASCSRRSRPTSGAPRSCLTQRPHHTILAFCVSLDRFQQRWLSNSGQHHCVRKSKLKRLLLPLRARRAAD